MVIIAEASEHDEQVALAEELMDKEDFRGAASTTENVLAQLEPHLPTISQAAVTHGQALMTEAVNKMEKTGEQPKPEILEKILESFELSQMLNPDCEETNSYLVEVSQLLRDLPRPCAPKEVKCADFDVIVVGAGAAGIGTALMLTETFGLHKSRVVLIERGSQVGETFRLWPEEMKFISPSFNQQGWTDSFDLNAISNGTSPAFSLHTEHPSGKEYATYLEALAKKHELKVRTLTEVVSILPIGKTKELPLFSVGILDKNKKPVKKKTKLNSDVTETIKARYIVWAAGEFQYPRVPLTESVEGKEEEKKSDNDNEERKATRDFPGTELCLHNSQVRSWAKLPGEDFLIIGGYESGVDAAVNLSRAGKRCKVLASTPCWSVKTTDPSAELAPYTAGRLRDVLAPGFSPKPQLLAPLRVVKVEKAKGDKKSSGFNVTAEWQAVEEESEAPSLRNLANQNDATEPQGKEGTTLVLHTPNPPVLCTGFAGSVAAVASHLFEFREIGDEEDHGDEESDDMEVEDDADNNIEKEDDAIEKDDDIIDDDVEVETINNERKGCLEGAPLLTKNDESTKVPGVFLVGPAVSHGSLSFCFVYKFRQRFAIVANAICQGLGMDTRAGISESRNANMYLDDFSCCADTCGDVC